MGGRGVKKGGREGSEGGREGRWEVGRVGGREGVIDHCLVCTQHLQ